MSQRPISLKNYTSKHELFRDLINSQYSYMLVNERERERERESERDRQTDRQAETDRRNERQRERGRDRPFHTDGLYMHNNP